jgi:hypothetical protein
MNQQTPFSRSHPLTMFASMARQLAASYPGPILLGTLVTGLLVGLLIGWVLLGWVIAPVVYTDIKPASLSPQYQEVLLRFAADSYVGGYTPVEEVAKRLGEGWTKAQVISRIDQMLAAGQPGADRLFALKSSLISFQGEVGPVPRGFEPADSNSIGLIALVLAATVALGVLIVRRIQSEQVRPAAADDTPASYGPSTSPPAASGTQPPVSPPVGREASGARPVDKPAWPGEGREPLVQYET